jgi:hypothetical protein
VDPLDDTPPLLEDGLPHSLVQCIRYYDLRYFKIKLCGNAERDLERLLRICHILTQECKTNFYTTLDADEQFSSLESLIAFYQQIENTAKLAPLLESLLWIEQPLPRDQSLLDEVGEGLRAWKNAPAIIMDESDADLNSLPRALELGYRGTSYKSCKGILKGLANASLIHGQSDLILSGEDLSTSGPVALLQDLSMMSALGITHVERNGHHYFKGFSAHPLSLQHSLLEHYPDLFRELEWGYSTLNLQEGSLDFNTLLHKPYGDLEAFQQCQLEPLNQWIKRGGMSDFVA